MKFLLTLLLNLLLNHSVVKYSSLCGCNSSMTDCGDILFLRFLPGCCSCKLKHLSVAMSLPGANLVLVHACLVRIPLASRSKY